MSGSYTKKEFGVDHEEKTLLAKDARNRGLDVFRVFSHPNCSHASYKTFDPPIACGTVPVRLSPGWEGTGKPEDELNFKGVTMDQADLEMNPPTDRWKLIALIFLLHGIGCLMPWNMFITAKEYFVDYKMGGSKSTYGSRFLSWLTLAAQIPNLLFSWLNLFLQMGGNLTARIVTGLLIQVIVFVLTVILAMADSTDWREPFFWITMTSVVVLNIGCGIYQNSVFGMAANLPAKYTGIVILGSNISGTLITILSMVTGGIAQNKRTAAIYYFISALLVLLACFDTYFALPLNRFYRYHELLTKKQANKKQLDASVRGTSRPPYWKIFKQCWPQCFNVFFVFFVTLTIFPAVQSDIRLSDETFIISKHHYLNVMCFLTFNVTAMIGSSIAPLVQWPSKKYVVLPILLRALYIPLFLICNYQPKGDKTLCNGQPECDIRTMPVYIVNDYIYWIIGLTMGLTSGYFSSVSMMYCPRTVEPQHQSTAGMFGAAFLVTGIFTGVLFSFVMPWIVSIQFFA